MKKQNTQSDTLRGGNAVRQTVTNPDSRYIMKEGERMRYSKLRGKIREVFGKNENFAKAMEIDLSSLSAKLNNKSPWKREEIEKACELLHIPIEEVHLYFFC